MNYCLVQPAFSGLTNIFIANSFMVRGLAVPVFPIYSLRQTGGEPTFSKVWGTTRESQHKVEHTKKPGEESIAPESKELALLTASLSPDISDPHTNHVSKPTYSLMDGCSSPRDLLPVFPRLQLKQQFSPPTAKLSFKTVKDSSTNNFGSWPVLCKHLPLFFTH